MLSLVSARQARPVAQFWSSTPRAVAASDLLDCGHDEALAHVLAFEVARGGEALLAFLLLERAYRATPTHSALGLLTATFLTPGAELELTVGVAASTRTTTAIGQHYAGRGQLPPPEVFAPCVHKVAGRLVRETLASMRACGALRQDGRAVQLLPFALDADPVAARARARTCQRLRALASTAKVYGLAPATPLLSLSC